jgi:hypothetical protein
MDLGLVIEINAARQGVVSALALLLDQMGPFGQDRTQGLGATVGRLFLGNVAQHLPGGIGIWSEAGVVSSTLGMSRTQRDARMVQHCLAAGDLAAARMAGRQLLARDTAGADGAALERATIEAIAVGVADHVVAPLFYYAVLGIPGALGYGLLASDTPLCGEWVHRLLSRARSGPRSIAAALYATVGSARQRRVDAMSEGWRQLRTRRSAADQERAMVSALVEPALAEPADGTAQTLGDGQAIGRALGQARVAVALGGAMLLMWSHLARDRRRTFFTRKKE